MGVKVTTGYTATASRDLTLTYKCSHCGYQNCATQRISGIGQTGLFFGKPTNPGYRQDAQTALGELIDELCSEKPSQRYINAEFNCKCRKCGKKEPWAKLHYNYMPVIWKALLWTFIFTFAFAVGELTPIPFLLWLGIFFWALFHKPVHSRRMHKQIDALAPESLPRITTNLNGVEVELKPKSQKAPEPVQKQVSAPKAPDPEPEPEPEPQIIACKAPPVPEHSLRLRISSLDQEVIVSKSPYTVGRGQLCDLDLSQLPNARYIARSHATFTCYNDQWFISDNQSTNGTQLNKERLNPQLFYPVHTGDVVTLPPEENLEIL